MARSKFEKRAEKELKKKGWYVDWKIRPSGFKNPKGYDVDFLGLFDLIAHRAGDPLRWISIKGQSGVPSEHREAIEKLWLPENNQKEIWYYRKLASDKRKYVPKKEVWNGEWIEINNIEEVKDDDR